MAKTAPFRIRLERGTEALIKDIAAREGRSRSAVASSLIEESARMRRFPGIGFRGGSGGRRAYVQGSFVDVWQIVESVKAFGDIDELLESTHLSRRQVELALAYYGAYQDEVDVMIDANRLSVEELRKRYPGLLIEEWPQGRP